jgi:hypothetical protein
MRLDLAIAKGSVLRWGWGLAENRTRAIFSVMRWVAGLAGDTPFLAAGG